MMEFLLENITATSVLDSITATQEPQSVDVSTTLDITSKMESLLDNITTTSLLDDITSTQEPQIDDFYLTYGQRLARVILLPFLIVVGIVGNILVVLAVIKTPKLQKVVNYFIVSLAVSDLLVCTIVLPLAIHQEFHDIKWVLDRWVCRMWVTLDVTLCTCSIWNLCLVSGDRYLAVVKPNQYAKWRTPRNAAISIAVVWVWSFGVGLMLNFASQDTGLETCVVTSKPAVTVLGPLFAFYIPCVIILFLYWRIYLMIKDFNLRRRPSTMSSSQDELSSTDTSMKTNVVKPSPSISRSSSYVGQTSKVDNEVFNRSDSQKPLKQTPSKRKSRWALRRSSSRYSSRKERKYAVVLAIVVMTFIGCWLPFFIIYLLQLCECAANLALPQAFNATTWLGWCNSLVNPIIYTIFNTDFRRAFKRILFCGKFSKRKFEYTSSEQNKT